MSTLSINAGLTAVNRAASKEAFPTQPPLEPTLDSGLLLNENLKIALEKLKPEELESIGRVINVLRKQKEQDGGAEHKVGTFSAARFTSRHILIFADGRNDFLTTTLRLEFRRLVTLHGRQVCRIRMPWKG
jgi:hypothetical protein